MPTPTCLHNSNISSDLLSFFNSSTSIIMFLLYLVLVLFLGALQAHGENVDKGVLIIGGAGFLGYHTTLELMHRGTSVVVLDNFDDKKGTTQWYWKRKRSEELDKKGVKVYHGDLCSTGLIKHFITSSHITGIVYFGGYVPEDATKYMTERLQCFVNLLEILRNYKEVPIVYSSSTDVLLHYTIETDAGSSQPVPLSFNSIMKSTEESFAKDYCQLYEIKIVGVRPFYSYGPLSGSESMIYEMAESIMKKGVIKLPHHKGKSPFKYDFTYVTDVANGICNALKERVTSCGVVYDLGSGSPQEVTVAADILKKELNKKATNKFEEDSLSPPVADTSRSMKEIDYRPSKTFQEGIKLFVNWYNDYSRKGKEKYKGKLNFVNETLNADVKRQTLRERSETFFKRMQNLRKRYEAQATGPVATFMPDRKFIFYPGVDSGRNHRTLSGKTIEEIKKECLLIDECVAFTPGGGLKSNIGIKKRWSKGGGLYVADIDVCKAGFHNCFGNYTCKYLGPSQFSCGCVKGWTLKGTSCHQSEYVEGVISDQERENMYTDRLNGHYWNGKMSDTFTEHKGASIVGKKIFGYPDAKGDVDKLKAACLHTYHCVGFNVKDNALMSEMKSLSKDKSSSAVAYTRNVL